jgi:recombination protein RecR
MTHSLTKLIHQFSKFPGIGKKTAERLAMHVLKSDQKFAAEFSSGILEIKEKTKFCKNCGNISEDEICPICSSEKRNKAQICVVADITDIFAIEKTNEFRGVYHVLGGVLSPLDGIGPDQLSINKLQNRIKNDKAEELILAITPTTEGEATVTYLTNILSGFELKISRIARGIPLGTQLDFIDQATLGSAISGRNQINY